MGGELLPLNPKDIKSTDIDMENFDCSFTVSSQLAARTLGQHIGVSTLYSSLEVFYSEVFLRDRFPIDEFRLNGDQLAYSEELKEDGSISVHIRIKYQESYEPKVLENFKEGVTVVTELMSKQSGFSTLAVVFIVLALIAGVVLVTLNKNKDLPPTPTEETIENALSEPAVDRSD